jgi:SAM-dependent methyltransferase/UDP-N-acetylglucosamine transferase subunit ALG13
LTPTTRDRLRVFVTVGKGPWPIDRLIAALAPVCAEHEVFAQVGTSTLRPPCPHATYLGYAETQRRIHEADVVVTHAGNTVRLVQRAGKIPLAVAREAARGEMRNDHQVHYLQAEVAARRVVALDGRLDDLAGAVTRHPWTEPVLLAGMDPLTNLDERAASATADLLDDLAAAAGDTAGDTADDTGDDTDDDTGDGPNPFADHPTARYRWAFDQLRVRTGRHLDLGVGDGTFAMALHRHTGLEVVGADPHPGYLAQLRRALPGLATVQAGDRLPFADASFDSVTLLDVLEHTADERVTLAQVHRVLRPGGLLVLSVPGRHVFSVLDPDNAKFRFPRVHRAVYSARFGAEVYRRRFVEHADGLRGDMAWERAEHTNYRASDLLTTVQAAGFTPRRRDGANLFWRFFQVPALLAPDGVRHLFDAPLRADGRLFSRANLFLTAEAS